MAADVLCGGRSYAQTRFLATEDSSTLTTLVRLFVFKNIHLGARARAGVHFSLFLVLRAPALPVPARSR